MSECIVLRDTQDRAFGSLMRGPDAQKPLRKRNRWKWCFKCRKRMPHMLMMYYDSKPSYYEPTVAWECGSCRGDHTEFNS